MYRIYFPRFGRSFTDTMISVSTTLFTPQWLMCILITITQVSSQSSECDVLRQMFSGCPCSTSDGGVVVDCSSRGLTELPAPAGSYSKPIYELKLNNNSIVRLGDSILSNLNITKLDLSGNSISTINDTAFNSLGNSLRVLILSGNSNVEPPAKAFSPLQQLEELTLSNYNVPHLDHTHTFLNSLSRLKNLTLDNWKIESLELDFLSNSSKLRSLTLINQPLPTLPVNALNSPQLSQLEKLRISRTNITVVTASAFSGTNILKDLDLSQNNIDTVQDGCFDNIGNSLAKLNLSRNSLTFEANRILGIKNLFALEELDLSSNNLAHIPNLSQLQNRKSLKLFLGKNKVTSVTENAFAGVSNMIHTLDLSQNWITSIDANSFTGFTRMEVLYLHYQLNISSVPLVLPSSLASASGTLKEFNVNGQEVNVSSLWSVVRQLNMLEILNIATVNLKKVSDTALATLTKLKTLDLSYNNLDGLTQTQLAGQRNSLKYLFLTHNTISALSSCIFSQYTSFPITLAISDNPLVCNCTIKWLLDRINNGTVKFIPGQEAVCVSDNQPLASKTVADLCGSQYSEPQCLDYTTTTRDLNIFLGQIGSKSFVVSWKLSDSKDLKQFTVRVSNSNDPQPVFEKALGPSSTSVEVTGLPENTQHEVCVTAVFNNNIPSIVKCNHISTTTNTSTDEPEMPQTNLGQEEIGIIVGAVIGGVVFLAILAAIVYLLIFRRSPKKNVQNNVPVQPRNFTKSELPSMNEDTRSFTKPRNPKGVGVSDHRDGMQVVAISDGQTGQGRVGRAQMLNSNGSYNGSGSGRALSSSSQPSRTSYENDHGPLPPTPSRPSSAQVPAGYYNMGYREDTYDEIPHGKESFL